MFAVSSVTYLHACVCAFSSCMWMNDYTNVFVMVLLFFFLFVFGLFILKFFVRFILVYAFITLDDLYVCRCIGAVAVAAFFFSRWVTSHIFGYFLLFCWAFPLFKHINVTISQTNTRMHLFVLICECVCEWIGSFFSWIYLTENKKRVGKNTKWHENKRTIIVVYIYIIQFVCVCMCMNVCVNVYSLKFYRHL